MNKALLAGIVGTAAVAVYALTRKSSDASSSPTTSPQLSRTPAPPAQAILPRLDAGLSSTELSAIQKALTVETNPANLVAFATTFEPMSPMAASLLRAKAGNLQGGTMTGGEEPCAPCTAQVTGAPIFRGLPFQFQTR